MPAWNSRQMPHPLLAPWSEDYDEEIGFVATVPNAVLTGSGTINVHIQYDLSSTTLANLIEQGKAEYVALLTCPHTFARESHSTAYPEQHIALTAGDYADTLMVTPNICTVATIEGFASPEHSPEYARVRPQGFHIAPATILAIGNTTAISLEGNRNPYSVIDLVADDNVTLGRFDLRLDQDRIKIHLSPADQSAIDVYRSKGAYSPEFVSLLSGVYLHAITEAIRRLPENSNKKWHEAIRWAIQRHGIYDEDEQLKNDAFKHAQTIMGNPIGHLLTVFSRREDEE